jgi:radical SAM family uncharacterized protein
MRWKFRPLRDFDVVAFTLQYELSYTNILNIQLKRNSSESANRGISFDGADYPIILAGGPCAYNAEPLAPFLDCILIGEGEEQLPLLLETIKNCKLAGKTKKETLLDLSRLQGVYVPEFYHVEYHSDGTVKQITAQEGVPEVVNKAIVKDFSAAYFPDKVIVPYQEAVHDRVMLEVMRGCTRGCRFCQAGMIYRPLRERSPEILLEQAEKAIAATGYEEISLVSLSTSDYTCINGLLENLAARMREKGVGVSLPSLRLDSFDVEIAEQVQKFRKSGLTFARKRNAALAGCHNKGVTDEDLLRTTGAAFRAGWSNIKLYYMIGLPTETYEDLDGIVEQARKVLEEARRAGRKGARVTVSVSSFVPKAFTPFQWEPQDPMEVLRAKQEYLKKRLKDQRIKFLYHDVNASFLEAVFARGDRKVADLLEWAVLAGCRFDSWSEHFRFDIWQKGMEQTGIDPHFYANRRCLAEEILPWDHLSSGVSKDFLRKEYRKALAGAATPDCRHKCGKCGICPDVAKPVKFKTI